MLDLRAWARSPEGVEMIESQKPFVAKGEVWQGFDMQMMRTDESQLDDKEIVDLPDIDGTKEKIWFRRKQRLESRTMRKAEEYSKRRGELRTRRNEVLESIERMEKLGVERSPEDVYEIKQIDARMGRLLDAKGDLQLELAEKALETGKVEDDLVEGEQPQLQAPCGKMSPRLHVNPKKWLSGHRMGCQRCKP